MKTDEVTELGSLDALDEAPMNVVINGKVTTWVWTFAGPGHEKTVEQTNRIARQRLHEEARKEQAVVNGKKWIAEEPTPDEVREKNVNWIVGRLLGWTPVKIDGEMLTYSEDAARKLLADPRKSAIYVQALEFLAADTSFTPRSATT
ncbi:branched-chain amino acid ABC transporter [Mesorhizobium sp. M6A.T.Ca.TU.002.02.2.1]|nr:branched-chain amino acid ABC transporter [Mesorhizobium sp. M6A.T.Ca.TU.002.02.2.1]